MRKHFLNDKIYYPKTIHSLGIVDSLVSIMLYEEMISCKKGLEYSSFGNTTSKFLLNLSQDKFRKITEEIVQTSGKIEEVLHSPKIPKTKISKRKISLEKENYNEINNEKNKPENCLICKCIGKSKDEKFFEFLEKILGLIENQKNT